MNYRPQRVSRLICEELSKMLARDVEFPEGVLVTITGVDVGKDLERAKVWLSILPSNAADAAFKIAERARNELQYRLMKKIFVLIHV